jgi:hypothetical protein
MIETMEASAEALAQVNQEKCTKQHALTVEKNVKFRSNLQKEDQYTAGTACRNTENQDSKFFSFYAA